MSYVPKPNTGSLWPNAQKVGDKHPDFRGDVVLDRSLVRSLMDKGEEMIKISISGWNATTMNGRDYISLKASEPFVPKPVAPAPSVEDDEDVPF